MATTPSIKIVKTFTYRGVLREFSNRYHFNGGTPADSAHWTTLADLVVLREKAIYANAAPAVTIVRAVGYAAGSDVPIFTKTYATAGTGAFASIQATPGDAAALVRYSTTARTSKNHPIYLYNYYHGAYLGDTSSTNDTLNGAMKTALTTYAGQWISGMSDGTNNYVRSGPNGATATGVFVEPLITHRDLPRG
jgi:hypothetical protein